jgi:hypothetical protein
MSGLLITLIGLHFLCDYPLQGEFLAVGKGSFAKPHFGVPWWHCMTAHCAIHALAVGMVLGPVYALAEFGIHFATDYGKCKGWFGINTDQAIHIGCKVAWVVIATQFGGAQ